MSIADVVRLFAVPIFGLIAYRDAKFRRVPTKVWYPLVGLGVVTLGFDLYQIRDAPWNLQRIVLLEVGMAVGFLIAVAVVLYYLEIADVTLTRALAVIGLVYPLTPTDPLFGLDLPLVRPGHGLLAFTILSNAALIGLLYPIGYVVWNTLQGHFSPVMFAGRPVEREQVMERHGRFLETSYGYTFRAPDLEAIKAYLRWREVTVPLIAQRPDALRDPNYGRNLTEEGASEPEGYETDPDDPWGVEEFLDQGEYVGALRPEEIRSVLELLAEEDEVWVSANFPFAVPIFAGLVIGVTFGDLATGLFQLVA